MPPPPVDRCTSNWRSQLRPARRTRFRCVAVVADTDELTPPCGACRQLLWEFAPDAEVILSNLSGKTERMTVRELLPRGFDGGYLA